MKVLVVVDMQNDFVAGSLGTKEAREIVPSVKKKIEKYFNNGEEIIFTRDTHYSNYLDTQEGKNLPVEHCIHGTMGWNVLEGLETPNCHYVDKNTFGWDQWKKTLGKFNFDEVELIGVCTDICVVSNALLIKALFPETKITVDASCCAGVTPEKHKAALEVMKSCQINVIGEKAYDQN
jgi:nicotinamidase-related amidase